MTPPTLERITTVTENQAQEPVVVVISNEPPTTKQQLTTAAISLGTALAVPVLITAGFAVAGVAGKLKQKMRRTPATIVQDFETEETTSTEE